MDYSTLSDRDLIAFLKSAQAPVLAEGFSVVVARYKGAMVSFLYRYVGDIRTAEDLAQETFLRVYRKIGNYDPTAKFSTWLYTIAVNLAKDEFKRRSRHPAKSLDWMSGAGNDTTRNVPVLADDGVRPEHSLEKDEMQDHVQKALHRLKVEERRILILKDVQELSYDEIAGILELPLGTVKSRISRARLAFKEVWKRLGV